MTTQFTVNQEVSSRSICDYDCIFRGTILSRTAKFVTIKMDGYKEPKRIKVKIQDGVEKIYPLGTHSMAISFLANAVYISK